MSARPCPDQLYKAGDNNAPRLVNSPTDAPDENSIDNVKTAQLAILVDPLKVRSARRLHLPPPVLSVNGGEKHASSRDRERLRDESFTEVNSPPPVHVWAETRFQPRQEPVKCRASTGNALI